MEYIAPQDRVEVARSLLEWSPNNFRPYPWRYTLDPYIILIAEKLLQQTAATNTVVRVFIEFCQRYPSVSELAQADVDEIKTLIYSLGFAYRAIELKSIGIILRDQYNGQVPSELNELLSLPGVGDYIARAVLSFAFERDIGVVDTGVARFLYRLTGMPGPLPTNPARNRILLQLADDLVTQGASRAHNFAVLDLCAQICRPRIPLCSICPLRDHCVYGRRGEL